MSIVQKWMRLKILNVSILRKKKFCFSSFKKNFQFEEILELFPLMENINQMLIGVSMRFLHWILITKSSIQITIQPKVKEGEEERNTFQKLKISFLHLQMFQTLQNHFIKIKKTIANKVSKTTRSVAGTILRIWNFSKINST